MDLICTGENFALRKPAIQSSTFHNGIASRAVDGNNNNKYYLNSCTHTNYLKSTPWWRVDLQQRIAVKHVKIANRGENLGQRLCGFEIRIGDSLENKGTTNQRCGAQQHIPSNKVKNVNCMKIASPSDIQSLLQTTLCLFVFVNIISSLELN